MNDEKIKVEEVINEIKMKDLFKTLISQTWNQPRKTIFFKAKTR